MANIYETPVEPMDMPRDSLTYDERIAYQGRVIQALEQRLTHLQQNKDFSFRARQQQYAIDRELATAHDERGALMHDRAIASVTLH